MTAGGVICEVQSVEGEEMRGRFPGGAPVLQTTTSNTQLCRCLDHGGSSHPADQQELTGDSLSSFVT